MLIRRLRELLWLSFRFGPELPGRQAKRQTLHYIALGIKMKWAYFF